MKRPTPLKRAIFEAGLVQKDIAAQVGIDHTQLSRIVNGLHTDDATRKKIAKCVRRPVSELWPDQAQQDAA